MNKQNLQFSSSLEKQNDAPVVASRYGFREEEIGGKRYLVPMTREEYLEAISQDPGITEDEKRHIAEKVASGTASCFMYTTMACATPNNCQWCHLGNVGTSYYCYCRNLPAS